MQRQHTSRPNSEKDRDQRHFREEQKQIEEDHRANEFSLNSPTIQTRQQLTNSTTNITRNTPPRSGPRHVLSRENSRPNSSKRIDSKEEPQQEPQVEPKKEILKKIDKSKITTSDPRPPLSGNQNNNQNYNNQNYNHNNQNYNNQSSPVLPRSNQRQISPSIPEETHTVDEETYAVRRKPRIIRDQTRDFDQEEPQQSVTAQSGTIYFAYNFLHYISFI